MRAQGAKSITARQLEVEGRNGVVRKQGSLKSGGRLSMNT